MAKLATIKLSNKRGLVKIKNSGLISLQTFSDYPDGDLTIGQEGKEIPFRIKRFYFINKLHHPEAVRGKHTHFKTNQIIFCLNGSFKLKLDDGKNVQVILMDDHTYGVILPPFVWHEMTDFSNDCVIYVVADRSFDPKDYIRDYDQFQRRFQG